MKNPYQTECSIGKAVKKKCDKLYAKWKGYGNLLNSCIDKKSSIDVII